MIEQATIFAARFEETSDFYKRLFPAVFTEHSAAHFELAFPLNTFHIKKEQTNEQPYYHFAFSIPYHLFDAAKQYVASQVSLNTENGKDEISFVEGVRSFYFEDPSGNVVECIAKSSLKSSASSFSAEQIAGLSEMSLTPANFSEAAELLISHALLDPSKDIQPDRLNFLPFEETTLLLAPVRYRWLFSQKFAAVFPQSLTIDGKQILIDEHKKLSVFDQMHK